MPEKGLGAAVPRAARGPGVVSSDGRQLHVAAALGQTPTKDGARQPIQKKSGALQLD